MQKAQTGLEAFLQGVTGAPGEGQKGEQQRLKGPALSRELVLLALWACLNSSGVRNFLKQPRKV